MPLCSISIDVDSIACYYRIHGLGEPPPDLADVVVQRCLPRFAELLDELEVPATFFVVAADADVEGERRGARVGRARVAELAAQGHEIASHSYRHPYQLARFARREIGEEIGRAHRVLESITGSPPRGFRAPGYDLSPAIQAELLARGYLYDSSLLPSPPYYLAKAAVMAAMAVANRPSGAVMTNPRTLCAPAGPYRPAEGAPFRRGDAALLELPVAVTPFSRVPAIGTSLLLSPGWLRRHWIRSMRRRALFNFELHAIDLADAQDDGIPGELVARQPDLRAPLSRKRAALRETIEEIARDFEIVTLVDAAAELAPGL